MRILQNKIFVGIVCIVIAAVFAFLLLPGLNKSKGDTKIVIKINQNIQAGTKIEEAMLTDAEVGSFGLSESVITNKDQIVGKYANCEITTEELILSSKLSDYAADKRLDNIIANGQKLATVSVSSVAAGVGNHLKSGDLISVCGYIDDEVMVFDELKNLEVYSVENDDAQNLDETNNDEDAGKIAKTITLIVNDIQAQKLIYVEYSGKLHIIFERRGAV